MEAENEGLRSGSSSPQFGVNSMEVEVKPVVSPPAPSLPSLSPSAATSVLEAENKSLRERVALLENLVKNVVALSNWGGIGTIDPSSTRSSVSDASIDWSALATQLQTHTNPLTANTTNPVGSGINATLSPGQPVIGLTLDTFTPLNHLPFEELPQSNLDISPFNLNLNLDPHLNLDSTFSQPQTQSDLIPNPTSDPIQPNPLACHPAVVALPFSSSENGTLQRAKGNHLVNKSVFTVDGKRVGLVARLVVALARRRGWTGRTQVSRVGRVRRRCGGV